MSLPERDAQAVLLVKAFEEVDGEGCVLDPASLLLANAEELQPTELLRRRAAAGLAALELAAPFLPRLLKLTRLATRLAGPVVLAALLIGLAATAPGSARRVNLLGLPLLAVIAWNLVFYLLAASNALLRGASPARFGQGIARLIAPALTLGYLRRLRGRLQRESSVEASLIGRALSRFLSEWRPLARPLVEARARRLLHLGAAALGLGMIAGLYLRGLAFEHRATWESAFLDDAAAQRVIAVLLGPAVQITGVETVPLAQLRAPAHAEAAIWVHLLAVTTALYVVIPRLLLAAIEEVRCHRLGRRLPLVLSGVYYQRVLAGGLVEERS